MMCSSMNRSMIQERRRRLRPRLGAGFPAQYQDPGDTRHVPALEAGDAQLVLARLALAVGPHQFEERRPPSRVRYSRFALSEIGPLDRLRAAKEIRHLIGAVVG